MKRIHIIDSGPRTGTTLLAEAMVACFDIDNYHDHEASICSTRIVSGNCYLTKKPSDINSVYHPLLLNKDLHVICLIRDPRDQIVSTHGAIPDLYYTGLKWWKLFTEKFEKLNTIPRFIPVKYEKLVTHPDRVQEHLLKKMSFLDKQHNFSDYHLVAKSSEASQKALKGVRPIKPKGVGKWENHLPRIKQQVNKHGSISNALIKFNYEQDKKWEAMLEGVEPRNYEQYKSEYFDFEEKMRTYRAGIYEVINILVRRVGLEPAKVYKPIKKMLNRE